METLTTNTTERKMSAGNGGTASYVFATDAPPAWLVAAVPGAADAKAAWESENAKGHELSRELRQTGNALVKFRRDPDVLAADLEAAERAHRAKERAVEAQGRRSLAALRKFDAAVYGAKLSPTQYRELAAAHALVKHEEAAALWEALTAALGERDDAWKAAGAPGFHWVTRSNALPGPLGAEAKSERLLAARIESFDVEAVRRAADGDKVKSAAEIHAEATTAAEAANKAAAAATRRRSGREAIIERNAN